ncbi:MAG TPA: hypothetical protein VHT05_07850 [Candidatus Elarobacter sp.]|jgi:hypothetical protein|nr:hypothetical protein [Candidatus Elarobacter sp.]
MAIRPTDLQGAIWQASQTAPLVQRAEDASRAAQQAAQASFAAQVQEREERVDGTGEALGNRVDPNAERRPGGDSYEQHDGRSRDESDGGDGLDEPLHLIDVTA